MRHKIQTCYMRKQSIFQLSKAVSWKVIFTNVLNRLCLFWGTVKLGQLQYNNYCNITKFIYKLQFLLTSLGCIADQSLIFLYKKTTKVIQNNIFFFPEKQYFRNKFLISEKFLKESNSMDSRLLFEYTWNYNSTSHVLSLIHDKDF